MAFLHAHQRGHHSIAKLSRVGLAFVDGFPHDAAMLLSQQRLLKGWVDSRSMTTAPQRTSKPLLAAGDSSSVQKPGGLAMAMLPGEWVL